MNKLDDNLLKYCFSFITPYRIRTLNDIAFIFTDKYINNITFKQIKEMKEIKKRINAFGNTTNHYIHFSTLKQANMAKPYLIHKKYNIIRTCCFGKGYFVARPFY